MLIDTTRCIGCRGCQLACKQWNGLSGEATEFSTTWSNPHRLTAKTWNYLDIHEVEQEDSVSWHWVKRMCMHCDDPACAAACPVSALVKTPDGPVLYESSRCIGCRYCMVACPFDVPAFEWESTTPLIKKCTFCADRISMNWEPACTKTCPTSAVMFGERSAMLAVAHERISKNPDRYVDRVYGEKEAGGTSVLYLAGVPFEEIGLPDVLPQSYAALSVEAVSKVPATVVGLAALLGGLSYIIQRREAAASAKEGAKK
jgi:formate dehydrogenase iron-sulfur subunit